MTADPGSEATSAPPLVEVWDPFVRLFHWTLVAAYAVSYLTGDELKGLHVAAGYLVLGLIGVRLVWGVVGPRLARFTSFVRPPREVLDYLGAMLAGRAPRYLGHNPAAGTMIVLLLALLTLTALTGIAAEGEGILAKAFEEVHEALADLSLGLVALHVAGVAASSLYHGENLVKAMLTGRKRAR
ncbi:MAG: cytochrome b/b6 domain-containing protein [Proteobacteria bacterium]|nr:cytochrome b/b6 domain-containing protein [Pseudomonadota bacterium]